MGGTTLYCPGQDNYIKTATSIVVVDDAGKDSTTGTRIPWTGTITGTPTVVSGTLQLPLVSGPPFGNVSAPNHVASFSVVNGGSLYIFGSSETLDCTACTSDVFAAIGTPGSMAALSTLHTGPGGAGTSGTANGVCTLAPVSQTPVNGAFTTFSGTVSSLGGSLVSVALSSAGLVINDSSTPNAGGTYTNSVIPTSSGCGPLSGVTISFAYNVKTEKLKLNTGIYGGTPPCNPAAGDTTTSTVGSGLTLTCTGAVFSGMSTYGTDNTVAVQNIIGSNAPRTSFPTPPLSVNAASAIAQPVCMYFPGGRYLMQPLNSYSSSVAPMPGTFTVQGFGCFIGDQHNISTIFVIPTASPGDVISFKDSNVNSSLPNLGNTQSFSNIQFSSGTLTLGPTAQGANQAGSGVRNLSIIGDRLSPGTQNGIAYYGKTQWTHIDNVIIDFMNGRGFYGGAPDSTSGGSFSESVIENLRIENCGNLTLVASTLTDFPSLEITSNGGPPSEGSNTKSLVNVRIFQSLGSGLWIHNTGTVNVARDFRIANLFIEGTAVSGTNAGGDLLKIGDPASSLFGVSDVLGRNVQLVNPVGGFAALHFLGDISGTATVTNSNMDIQGAIIGGAGRGVQFDFCAQCKVNLAAKTSGDYNIVVGPTIAPSMSGPTCSGATIGTPGIIYDGNLGYLGATPFTRACRQLSKIAAAAR